MDEWPKKLISPAKLNLGLHITGRRSDGYHELESLFWPIDFADEIFIEPASEWSLKTRWADDAPIQSQSLPSNEENLISNLIRELAPRSKARYSLELNKRIPMGAGLGGGSSNVGTLIRFFRNREQDSDFPWDAISKNLGADVPFFLDPKPSWIHGVGERQVPAVISPALSTSLRFLLVLFPEGLETQNVYRKYDGLKLPLDTAIAPEFPLLIDPNSVTRYLSNAQNRLESAAVSLFPVLGNCLARLRSEPFLSTQMTGSGSACFSILKLGTELERSLDELKNIVATIHSGARLIFCNTVSVI